MTTDPYIIARRENNTERMRIKRAAQKIAAGLLVTSAGLCDTAAKVIEAEIVAAVIIAEAGGEGYIGMEAVREVIYTRAQERKQTETHIVTAPKQFSCLNGTSADELIRRCRTHRNWTNALYLATRPPQSNHTKGANHYYAPKGVKRPPSWADEKKLTTTIKGHKFYRL